MRGFKTIAFALAILSMVGCGRGEDIVEELCKYVTDRQTEFSVTPEQIEKFSDSRKRTARYLAFYEVLTSVDIPADVVRSELAKCVFHDKGPGNGQKRRTVIAAYDDAVVEEVKSLKRDCREIKKTLSAGRIPDARIARYLVGFLGAPSQDRPQIRKDCANFIKMCDVVADFVRETVTEAEDAVIIFTDGSLDEEIREESRKRGKALEPFSMMASRPTDKIDYLEKLTNGTAVAQLGFSVLVRMGKNDEALSKACISGTLFRYGKMSENVRLKGVEFAEKLSERILDLQRKNVLDSIVDEEMNGKFLFVQWRISRLFRMRAEQEKQRGLKAQAKRSSDIADRLDDCNSAVKGIRKNMEDMRAKMGRTMTTRERLQLALVRADFEMGQAAAQIILKENPDDSNANFAMGMWHFQHERWKDAEKYLLRCKEKNPKEPAVWNNLAIIYMKIGKMDEAKRHVREALRLVPDSPEVKDTFDEIEKARAK